MAAGEEMMLDPRAPYRGGLAGLHHDLPSRPDARRGASGLVVWWMRKTVQSLKTREMGLAGVVESEPK